LKPQGLEVRLLAGAIGFHHKSINVRDLVERELEEGRSAVYLHSKFPSAIPQVEDADALARNESQSSAAEAAIQELTMLEHSDCQDLPPGAYELFRLRARRCSGGHQNPVRRFRNDGRRDQSFSSCGSATQKISVF
jgi:hypothetical protein